MTLLSGKFLAMLIGLLTSLLTARILGAEQYGVVAFILAYPYLIKNIAEVKSGDITIRYFVKFLKEEEFAKFGSTIKWGYLIDIVGAMLALILLALAFGVGLVDLSAREYEYYAMLFSTSIIPLSSCKTSRALLIALEEFRAISILNFLEKLVVFCCVIPPLLAGWGVRGYILSFSFSNVLICILYLLAAVQCAYKYPVKIMEANFSELNFIKSELMQLFGWNYLIVSIKGLVLQLPVIFLGEYGKVAEAGYFRLAMTFMGLAEIVENALASVVYPKVSQFWGQRSWKALSTAMRNWTLRDGTGFSFLVLIGTFLLPFFVKIFYGTEFEPMIFGAQILLAGVIVKVVFFWTVPFFYSLGFLKELFVYFLAYGLLLLLTGGYVVDRFGYLGLCLLYTLLRSLYAIAMVIGAFRRIKGLKRAL